MSGPTGRVDSWAGRRVAVLGAAKSGVAAANLLAELGADVVLSDTRPLEAIATDRLDPRVTVRGGKNDLAGCEMVVPSPGIPPRRRRLRGGPRRRDDDRRRGGVGGEPVAGADRRHHGDGRQEHDDGDDWCGLPGRRTTDGGRRQHRHPPVRGDPHGRKRRDRGGRSLGFPALVLRLLPTAGGHRHQRRAGSRGLLRRRLGRPTPPQRPACWPISNPGDTAVLRGDDPIVARPWRRARASRRLLFGPEPRVRLGLGRRISLARRRTVSWRRPNSTVPGRHNVCNALATLAAAEALGLSRSAAMLMRCGVFAGCPTAWSPSGFEAAFSLHRRLEGDEPRTRRGSACAR
jgi:hypothetical protein